MVKQGDIIKVNLNPTQGHEQSGFRPVLVISNNAYHRYAKMAIVCPITNTDNKFPLHVALDKRAKTTGVILCEHIRTLDVEARGYNVVEKVSDETLANVLSIVKAELDI